jgi:hypothetical protein
MQARIHNPIVFLYPSNEQQELEAEIKEQHHAMTVTIQPRK